MATRRTTDAAAADNQIAADETPVVDAPAQSEAFTVDNADQPAPVAPDPIFAEPGQEATDPAPEPIPAEDPAEDPDAAPATEAPAEKLAVTPERGQSGLTDAINEVRSANAARVVPEEQPAMAEGNDTTPGPANTPIDRIEASGYAPTAVVAQTADGEITTFDSEQEAMDAGAAVLDRASPHLSPMLASEPAILRNRPTPAE